MIVLCHSLLVFSICIQFHFRFLYAIQVANSSEIVLMLLFIQNINNNIRLKKLMSFKPVLNKWIMAQKRLNHLKNKFLLAFALNNHEHRNTQMQVIILFNSIVENVPYIYRKKNYLQPWLLCHESLTRQRNHSNHGLWSDITRRFLSYLKTQDPRALY